MLSIDIETKDKNAIVTTEQREDMPGVLLVDTEIRYPAKTLPEPVTLRFSVPCVDIYSVWSHSLGHERYLNPNWNKRKTVSRLCVGAPIHSLFSVGGKNRLTVAVSDGKTPLSIATGIVEEDSTVQCEITFFTEQTDRLQTYRATLRLDTRDLPYYEVISSVDRWWDAFSSYRGLAVPDAAKRPVYSTWYSFHQKVDVEAILEECKEAKRMGMDTVIVDDGWETTDVSRSFSYTGDWVPEPTKVPDMKDFVRRIHGLGMKCMLWYSLPFVGKTSRAKAKFSDMLLGTFRDGEGEYGWSCLDPRYPEVRRHLTNVYASAVRDWDLDGFKIDFVENFEKLKETRDFDERWDYTGIDDAVEALLSDIIRAVTAEKPDIMIEFRQKYIGPAIRRYGNILRVSDCPNDAIKNRVGGIDLRLTSGGQAVQSDMLMWNLNEPAESAARQLLDCFFIVPQISVRLYQIPEDHRKMLRFFLGLWNENRDVILNGTLCPKNPESLYSTVLAQKDGNSFAVAYVNVPLSLPEPPSALTYVNATADDRLYLTAESGEGTYGYEVFDCRGETVSSGTCTLSRAAVSISVPPSGVIRLTAKNA